MTKKKNKSVVISVRLAEDDYLKYKESIDKLGVSESAFFRSLITDTFDPDKMNMSKDRDISKMLFYYNKSSNNINQLAKSVNISMMNGGIDSKMGGRLLTKLDLISQSFINGINGVKK